MFCIKKTPVADEEPEYVAARSPQQKLQFRILLRKARDYKEHLAELRSSMVRVDRFLESAEYFRMRDVERAMSNLGRALELQVSVANSQSGLLMSVTSDMALIPDHLSDVATTVLQEELRRVTSHSVRVYVDIDPHATEQAKVNHAFEAVTSNGSRVYLSTFMLDRLVLKIIEKMQPLEATNKEEPAQVEIE